MLQRSCPDLQGNEQRMKVNAFAAGTAEGEGDPGAKRMGLPRLCQGTDTRRFQNKILTRRFIPTRIFKMTDSPHNLN